MGVAPAQRPHHFPLPLYGRALLVDGGDEPPLAHPLRHLGQLHVDEELLVRGRARARARARARVGVRVRARVRVRVRVCVSARDSAPPRPKALFWKKSRTRRGTRRARR